MVPPTPTKRRALAAAAWLTVAFAGLITAVWAVGQALTTGAPPSLSTVAEATRLDYPDGTDVVEADLAQMHTPTPGSRGQATVAIDPADFGDFIAANGMEAPLLAGTAPNGATTGIIPPGCTDTVCYRAALVIDHDTVTVELTVTLL